MKKRFTLLFIVCMVGVVAAWIFGIFFMVPSAHAEGGFWPPGPVVIKPDGNGGGRVGGPLSVGDVVKVVDVEYTVWKQKDLNGDVIAKMTVICTDLTDGDQDCTVKIYETTAGVLSSQGTWP